MGQIIENLDFTDALSSRYLSYALTTITSRSLPDVRDGLKPVHRRILYAMLKLHLDPNSSYKKSARVVGDVIGKYHPHGDSSVYDALVRLAQIFASRYPLVEGQGNFGSVDGDNAAAMRYTEAKLTFVAMLLLKDIDKNVVDFNPTYDDSDYEPEILPAAFPNLLANGSEGIAVGMATSIFPHNIIELLDAVELLLNQADTPIEELVKIVKAPDFPTGGEIIYNKNDFINLYKSGRGSFKLRSKWFKEELAHGAYQIVITEIPYQICKARLLEKIADICNSRKIGDLGSIADESSDDIRIIISPKTRNVDADILMAKLFKETDLESNYTLNLNVLDKDKIPRVMGLDVVLREFIDHRYIILNRKLNFLLAKINKRLEILAGYLIVYLNIDEVIRIIRFEDDPKFSLKTKFNLTDIQVEAIFEIKLRALQKLEEIKIVSEQKKLSEEKKEIDAILKSKEKQRLKLIQENQLVREEFKQHKELVKRRTKLIKNFQEIDISSEELIEEEKITIFISNNYWIRPVKGHGVDKSKIKYRIGDKEKYMIELSTIDKLIIATNKGKFYCLFTHKLDLNSKESKALNLIFDFDVDEKIIFIETYQDNKNYVLISDNGKGFIINSKEFLSQKRTGKSIFICDNNHLFCLRPIDENDDSLVIVNNIRKMSVIKLSELPVLNKGKGVILQKQLNSEISDIININFENGLEFKLGSKKYIEKDMRRWLVKRASKGYLVPFRFPRKNKFFNA